VIGWIRFRPLSRAGQTGGADGVLVDSSNQPAKDAPLGTVIYGNRTPAGALETSARGRRRLARTGTTRVGCLRTLTTAIDTALVGDGGARCLPVTWRSSKRMHGRKRPWRWPLTGLLALLGSILVMVHAFRAAEHRCGMVFIFSSHCWGMA